MLHHSDSVAAGPIGDTATTEPSRDSVGEAAVVKKQAYVGSSDHWPLLDAAKHNMISVSGVICLAEVYYMTKAPVL